MNRNLSNIEQLIQQSSLTDEEKQAALKEISSADKQWNIIEFKLERTEQVKKTTGVLLEETIEELEQKRKAVEEKNRDLEIEAALERVRTVAMGMRIPDDLLNICKILFEELTELGFGDLRNAMVNIINDEKGSFLNYDFNGIDASVIPFQYNSHPVIERQVKITRSAGDAFIEHILTGDDLENFKAFRVRNGEAPDPKLENIAALYYYFYSIGVGSIGISTLSSLSEAKLDVLKRFRNVFDLAYRRYVDIKQAEEQAREARIETALERVRAVAMAMKKPNEILTVCEVMYNELRSLGIGNIRNAQIAIQNQSKQSYLVCAYSDTDAVALREAPYAGSPIVVDLFEELEKSKDAFYQREFSGQKFEEWRKWRETVSPVNDIGAGTTSLCFYLYSFGPGHLGISTYNPITTDQIGLLKRFKNVFELCYRRYADVAQAEAQAREAQIELGLERVRARAMAMQNSDELAELVHTVFKELTKLDFALTRCIINILDEATYSGRWWMANAEADKTPASYFMKYNELSYFKDVFKAWKERNPKWEYALKGKEKLVLDDYMFSQTELKMLPPQVQAGMRASNSLILSAAYGNFGCLHVAGLEPLSENNRDILARFGKVFDLTYTRFNDLKQAEAQAREAQIELGLERVRSRAMAMQSSTELSDLVTTLFAELSKLDFALSACIINIIDGPSLSNTVWFTGVEDGMALQSFHMKFEDYPFHDAMWDGWKAKKTKYVYTLQGQEKLTYDDYLLNETEFSRISDTAKAGLRAMEQFVCSFTFCNFGGLQTVGAEPLSEANLDILARFGKVFDLTYTRFNDLKQAEAQARESQIQLALERVRARTMAMQKSEELPETSSLLFQQVKELGETAIQNSIAIVNEEAGFVELSTTVHGSHQLRTLNVPIDDPYLMAKAVAAWMAKRQSLILEYKGQELKDYNALRNSFLETKINFPEDLWVVHITFFSKGWLSFSFNKNVSDEIIVAQQRFAAVFEQTYTRFLDLQKAEKQVRQAQIEVAMEKVRSRALAMQKPDELIEVAGLLRQEMALLGVEELETSSIYIHHEDSAKTECWYTIKDEHKLVADHMDMILKDTWVGRQMLKFYHSDKTQVSILMKGGNRKEWINYCSTRSKLLDGFYGDNIPDRTYHLCKFSDGYMGAASPGEISAESWDLLQRATAVFSFAYTRFNDLQQAEAQAREAKIEAALERVRSRSMGMQKSEELKEVIQVVFDQFVHLNIGLDHTGFVVDYKPGGDWHFWVADHIGSPNKLTVSNFDSVWNNDFDNAKKNNLDFFTTDLDFEAKNKFYRDMFGHFPDMPQEYRDNIFSKPGLAASTVLMENVALYIENFSGTPYTDEENSVLMRFGKVFQQTYTRFLDLQRAEEQAREAQIEAALEKVRSRSLAMHQTDELNEVVSVVFEKLHELGIVMEQEAASIVIFTEGTKDLILWNAIPDQSYSKSFHIPYYNTAVITTLSNAKAAGTEFFERNYTPEEKDHFWQWAVEYSDYKNIPDERKKQILESEHFACSVAFTKNSAMLVSSYKGKLLSEKEGAILKRFARVFEQAYVRFLDLKQAEEQVRESQIQLALERVRARTSAMQKSDELAETVSVLFKQLLGLGIPTEQIRTCGIVTFDAKKPIGEQWITDLNGDIIPRSFMVPYDEAPAYKKIYKWWKQGEAFEVNHLEGKALQEHLGYLAKYTKVPLSVLSEQSSEIYNHVLFFSQGCLFIITRSAVPEYHEVFRRFGAVFRQSYTRFLDLQKAEAQAREARIEAALEKVRSRSLAMHKTDELQEVVNLVHEKLQEMGIAMDSAIISIPDEKTRSQMIWIGVNGVPYPKPVLLPDNDDPISSSGWEAWYSRVGYFARVYSFDEKNQFYNWAFEHSALKYIPAERRAWIMQSEAVGYSIAFSKVSAVWVVSYSGKLLDAEEAEILKRFGRVFEQAYIRFLDLQKAEAQVREAQIEAALERTRTQSMIMQHSSELDDTLRVFHEQVLHLGIRSAFSFLWLPDEEKDRHIFWAAWAEGDSKVFKSKAIDYPLDRNEPATAQCLIDWKGSEPVVSYHVPPDEVESYFAAWQELIAGVDNLKPDHFRDGVHYVEAFMKYGCFGVMVKETLSNEEKRILGRFAIEFERTYTRFLDLQKAEAQAHESQIQLALERVRARTMAMQKSEELHEVIQLVFDQLRQLNFNIDVANFALNYKKTDDFDLLIAVPHGKYATKIHVPYLKHPLFDHFNKAKEKGGLLVDLFSKDEKDSFFEHFFKYVPNVPEETKTSIFKRPGFIRSSVLMKNTALTIHNYDGIPYSEVENRTLLRFGQVFEQTYTRFTDLKQTEEQARESQIQLALERVRARTMAMQRSEELAETVFVLFQQFKELGENPDQATIGIINEEEHVIEYWVTMYGEQNNNVYKFSIDEPNVTHKIYKGWKAHKKSLVIDLSGKELLDFATYRQSMGGAGLNRNEKRRIINVAFFSKGLINVQSTEERSEESILLLERFAAVFDGTYTRFLDLQKAETQAREARIEAALERVRSKTMAMHNSNDVADTVAVMFDELVKLGVEKAARCGIGILTHDSSQMELWTAKQGENEKPELVIGHFDMNIHPMLSGIYDAWHKKESSFSYVLTGDDMISYFETIKRQPGYPIKYDINKLPSQQYQNDFCFAEGILFAFTSQPLSTEISLVFKRFAGVFGQTYRRYLDLQKAETQARESQIQLALERVRARTMAMQKSDELAETSVEVFKQLIGLGIAPNRLYIGIIKDDSGDIEFWATDEDGSKMSTKFTGNMKKNRSIKKMYDAWAARQKSLTIDMKGRELQEYFKYMADELKVPFNLSRSQKRRMQLIACFSQGFIGMASPEPQPEETIDLMERFAGVFNLTYTRFNDLKLAEEQAREAKIEAALERVRGKALAMYNSADLTSTASMVFTELRKLGINPIRCGVGMMSKRSRKVALYSATTSTEGDSLGLVGWVMLASHRVLENIYESLLSGDDYFPVLKGKQLKAYYAKLLSGLLLPTLPDFHPGEEQYGHFFPFADGCLYAWAERRYNETEIRTLRRFASVIDLTFRRYIELQKSEASAREAIRAASLDRVRAEIASMRSTSDLDRITPLIWNELTILGIPFIRCGVFIVDEDAELFHTHLSTADGKALATFDLKFDSQGIGQNVLPAWRQKQVATLHWSKEEFAEYTKNLVSQGTVKSQEKYVTEHPDTSLDLHFAPFLQGMLYVGNITPLTTDEMDLVQLLADAFSTAYARYEDFNKLEAAKQQVENTLTDLKAAQTKLIQSEKMASLGELTAGIAHEIQNPLNFVNNFSEVNQEMLEELKAESLKPKAERDEQLEMDLIKDLIENEQKISHHGKRADGIVKGMLQHSRTGGGEKQPTNINLLADEFMRLSYHGLRAKDKVFNAELVTHFDPDLPKVSVIGQDMGRVLLNLFNNAFYAVNQKKKALNGDYKPEVSVTTLTENGQVVIKVKDNGVGMPDHIKEKIMQPFFTTKPTGEGTGLGLSLTYDMVVKGHGGTIQVNSVEGEGSEFIIAMPLN